MTQIEHACSGKVPFISVSSTPCKLSVSSASQNVPVTGVYVRYILQFCRQFCNFLHFVNPFKSSDKQSSSSDGIPNGFSTSKKRCIMDYLDIRDLNVRRSADWEALPSNWCPRNLFPSLDSSILPYVSSFANLQTLWRHRFHLVSPIFHVFRRKSFFLFREFFNFCFIENWVYLRLSIFKNN